MGSRKEWLVTGFLAMRWQVQIVGDRTALSLLVGSLNGETLSIQKRDDEFLLSGAALDAHDNTRSVADQAREILGTLSGAYRLWLGGKKSIRVAAVYELHAGGRRSVTVVASPAVAEARAQLGGVVTRHPDGSETRHGPGEELSDSMAGAWGDPSVQHALRLRDRSDLLWTDLYAILELITKDPAFKPQSVSRREIEAVQASANHPAVAGDHARHSVPKSGPPPAKKRVSLPEARRIVDLVLKEWIRSKNSGSGGVG